jgi:hypothetical protein
MRGAKPKGDISTAQNDAGKTSGFSRRPIDFPRLSVSRETIY